MPAPSVVTEFKEPEPSGDKAADDIGMFIYYRVLHASKSLPVKSRLMTTLHPDTTAILGERLGLVPQVALAVDWSVKNRCFALLNNLAVIAEGDNTHESFHLQALNGLNAYPRPAGSQPLDLSLMDERGVAPYRAVVKAAETITGSDIVATSGGALAGTAVQFRDPAMAQFIMSNHERLDAVIHLIQNSGRVFDAELFQIMLDSPSPAVREGEL